MREEKTQHLHGDSLSLFSNTSNQQQPRRQPRHQKADRPRHNLSGSVFESSDSMSLSGHRLESVEPRAKAKEEEEEETVSKRITRWGIAASLTLSKMTK